MNIGGKIMIKYVVNGIEYYSLEEAKKANSPDIKKMIDAAKMLQDMCQEQQYCCNCIFDGKHGCMIDNPCDWNFDINDFTVYLN